MVPYKQEIETCNMYLGMEIRFPRKAEPSPPSALNADHLVWLMAYPKGSSQLFDTFFVFDYLCFGSCELFSRYLNKEFCYAVEEPFYHEKKRGSLEGGVQTLKTRHYRS